MIILDQARLDEIRAKLKELPKVEKVKKYSSQAALEALKPEVKALTKKGYDPKAIAKILKDEGVKVSAAKVKLIIDGNGATTETQTG